MSISAVFHVSPPEDGTLRLTMGHHAHVAFLALLRLGNPQIAEAVHATSSEKPFTVLPLIAKGTRHCTALHLRSQTPCKLRFTFLQDEFFAHFAPVFFADPLPSIRLGAATFQVNRLLTTLSQTDGWGARRPTKN